MARARSFGNIRKLPSGRYLLTTFRKQRNNERAEIARARKIAEDRARLNP